MPGWSVGCTIVGLTRPQIYGARYYREKDQKLKKLLSCVEQKCQQRRFDRMKFCRKEISPLYPFTTVGKKKVLTNSYSFP